MSVRVRAGERPRLLSPVAILAGVVYGGEVKKRWRVVWRVYLLLVDVQLARVALAADGPEAIAYGVAAALAAVGWIYGITKDIRRFRRS